MTRLRPIAASVALVLVLVLVGCESDQKAEEASPGALALCTDCGHAANADACCDPSNDTCGCGLAKGSPGCCRIEKGSDESVAVCTACGHLKGTASCCDPDNPDCAACNLDKGSAGCCKIDTTDA